MGEKGENAMQEEQTITPIAHIYTDFKEKFGIPRQSGRAPALTAKIVFMPPYCDPSALRGLEGFSHLWLIFDFSLAHRKEFSPTVRPPRLGGNTHVGVFASRSPFRPNSLGLSCVRLLGIEHSESEGDVLIVSGADLLDGTPIYDVKPYLPSADCIREATGGYAAAFTDYRLKVIFPSFPLPMPEAKRLALEECLAEDPRPSYIDDPARIYGMRFAEWNIKFKVVGDTLTVLSVELTE
jgi:tRNA-Thr(GGU) m(6)t(6)A37 methyltransferase TsaA